MVYKGLAWGTTPVAMKELKGDHMKDIESEAAILT